MPLCLRVNKAFGEIARDYIHKNNLLNTVFTITREDDSLLIPIKDNFSEQHKKELIKLLGSIEIIEDCQANKAIIRPSSHIDVLAEEFSERELELAPRSFDTIGDIVVIEIPVELHEKRVKIGQALMLAQPSIKSVYAKTGIVEGVNRIRPVEYLVGEKKTKTIYIEHGIRLAVDIKKAYFSPRLSTEHARIAQQVSDNEIIVDLFCGIGPFAIPIIKHSEATVHAIDINAEAINLLKENLTLNKLKGSIIPHTGDCRVVVKEKKLTNIADRIIMNLPGYAINFMDVACDVLKKEGGIIHFFRFISGDNPEETITQDLARELEKYGRKIVEVLEVKRVRMSAPKQWQMVIDAKVV
ncbi:MAG: class I SAM-dependent methyltransferase [Candidatus Heimdallarchaeota archaeon]